MITAKETSDDLVNLEIKLHLPKEDIIAFLIKKSYKVKPFTVEVPPNEEFLMSEPGFTYDTFTAMKSDKKPEYYDLYLKVFEKEIKEFLNI
ncbi:hypothetical protein [Chryseobacterium sp.]|uniref:hypothetical protein n=1 Tax=Chryseobacterium sp. TaxID=1871047 RepID=UPI0028988588|nr:hypothetical protein [Chryseobacterium sp.]